MEADARSHMGKQVVCSVTVLGGLVKDAVVCVVSGWRRATDESWDGGAVTTWWRWMHVAVSRAVVLCYGEVGGREVLHFSVVLPRYARCSMVWREGRKPRLPHLPRVSDHQSTLRRIYQRIRDNEQQMYPHCMAMIPSTIPPLHVMSNLQMYTPYMVWITLKMPSKSTQTCPKEGGLEYRNADGLIARRCTFSSAQAAARR